MVAHHRCAGLLVIGIGVARAGAGIALDQHLVAAFDELIGCRGQQGHPVFLVFYLFRYADDHNKTEEWSGGVMEQWRLAVCYVAFFYNQTVDPVAGLLLALKALNKFQ